MRKGTAEKTLVDFLMGETTHKGKGHPGLYAARATAHIWNAAYQGRGISFTRVVDTSGPITILGTRYNGKG